MHTEFIAIRGNPAAVEEAAAFIRDEVMPTLQHIDGSTGVSLLVDRESGRCIIITVWISEEAMRGGAQLLRASWTRAEEILGGSAEVAEWHIALLHRQYGGGSGAARVAWLLTDPAHLAQALDAYRIGVLSNRVEIPGFRSTAVLADWGSGRLASVDTFENRDALERSRAQRASLRDEFIQAMGLTLLDVEEFEIVLASGRAVEAAMNHDPWGGTLDPVEEEA
ncbi:hypothetical protein ACI8AC_24100 [Geodermatophilus sp. SYSU D00758]